VQVILSFATPPQFHVCCLFASVNRQKNHYLKVTKPHCSLTTQSKNCEYHPAHPLLFIIISGG